jgi:hypothetical protein
LSKLTDELTDQIENLIIGGVEIYFPQVEINLDVVLSPDDYTVTIYLKYSVINTNIEDELQININIMAESKQIQYINKDFDGFKQKLLEFAQVYYPNTYNDFSETSPGLMLIEMASYVGDVLSFYGDNQVQENFFQFAKQKIVY